MSNPICKADFNGFANYKYVLDNNKNIFDIILENPAVVYMFLQLYNFFIIIVTSVLSILACKILVLTMFSSIIWVKCLLNTFFYPNTAFIYRKNMPFG